MANAGSLTSTYRDPHPRPDHRVRCIDCKTEPATRTFLHMTKGHFPLCEECFVFADHEEDYLEFCDCFEPDGPPDALACRYCVRPIHHCGCCRAEDFEIRRCFTCKGVTGRFFEHKARFDVFHEELMQKTWHPTRVARWLEQGEEVLDMMFGL